MQIQRKRFSRKISVVFAMIFALVGAGCVSHPLVPDETRGKTFAVYPASIALTVKEASLKDTFESLFIGATAGKPVQGGNLGPPLMHELAIRFEREFGVRKVADLQPLSSSKSTGGILTEAEVKSDYQNVADYLVQFDSAPSTLFERWPSNIYVFNYHTVANVYDAKTGQRLDWAGCSGLHGSAPLADWLKDNGKMIDVETQKIASKCADEMIRKLNKVNRN